MENKNSSRLVIAFIVICFVLGAIVTLSQLKSQPLSGYVEGDNDIVVTLEPYVTPFIPPDMKPYQDDTLNLKMEVPAEWTRVIKDGHVTFIHAASGAYVQIQKQVYNPAIHNVTPETATEWIPANATLMNYSKNDVDSFTFMYRAFSDTGDLDYVSRVLVDKQYLLHILICVPDSDYLALEKEVIATADSIQWVPSDPLPKGYLLTYSNFGNFEFAVPNYWLCGIENNEYVAWDNQSGAELHVSVVESDANYTNVTSEAYASFIGGNIPGFELKEFTASPNLVYAVSGYTVNNIQVYRVDYLIASGAYEYTLSFVCPTQTYQEQAPIFETSFRLFRTF